MSKEEKTIGSVLKFNVEFYCLMEMAGREDYARGCLYKILNIAELPELNIPFKKEMVDLTQEQEAHLEQIREQEKQEARYEERREERREQLELDLQGGES